MSVIGKMDRKQFDIWEELFQFFYKYGTYVGLVFLGLVGKFSWDLMQNKRRSRMYTLGSAGVGIFGGYLACVYMFQNYPQKAPLLVPLITMTSNNLVSAIMTIDYKALAKKDWEGAFKILFKK